MGLMNNLGPTPRDRQIEIWQSQTPQATLRGFLLVRYTHVLYCSTHAFADHAF